MSAAALFGVARAGPLDVLEKRPEAQLDSVNVPAGSKESQ